MTDNEALIPRIKAILADLRATSAESFQLQRLVVDYTERTVTSNDRERIAELERDLAHAHAELNAGRGLCERCEVACSGVFVGSHLERVINERDEARANLAQNAAITETLRAELATYKLTTVGTFGGVPVIEVTSPVVEEEQGPWVFYEVDAECLMWGGIGDHEEGEVIEWSSFLDDVTPWSRKADVEALHTRACEDSGVRKGSPKMRVITLDEARRIAGAK